jgi:uncharacterized protein HemX
MNRSVVSVSFGGVAIIFGLTVMLFNEPYKMLGGIIVLLGLGACMWSYTQVNAEDHRELDRRRREAQHAERMEIGLNALNKNIGELAAEIRQDREELNKVRSQTKSHKGM